MGCVEKGSRDDNVSIEMVTGRGLLVKPKKLP